MNRRSFLLSAGGVVTHPLLNSLIPAPTSLLHAAQQSAAKKAPSKASNLPRPAADHSLTIKPCTIEISPGVNIKTTAYNGQVPGSLLRLRQGVPVTIDVTNETGNADIVHWHGLAIDSLNDGAMEEGSPMIPAGGHLRYSFTPNPAGSRWYHTHATAGANLSLGTYTGQFGFLLVEGASDLNHYDQEVFWPSIIGNRSSSPWSRPCRPSLQTIRRPRAPTSAISTPPLTNIGWVLASRFA
jgi:FtsP/CotA-like multicopper oxidase with cupredoxin domain